MNHFNPLLNSIFSQKTSSKQKNIISTLSNHHSVALLIPSTLILEWSIEKESLLPYRDICGQDDFMLSHIIEVSDTNRSQRARYFGTLSGKTVLIKEGYVFTHKGFKSFVRAKILSEYLFSPGCSFLPENAQFLVYEIDAPLIGTAIPSKDVTSSSGNIQSVRGQNSLKVLNDQSSYQALSNLNIPFERLLSLYPQFARQISGPMLTIIEGFQPSTSNTVDEMVQRFDDIVESSIVLLQSVEIALISHIIAEQSITTQDISQMVEIYIEENLYDNIWERLIELDYDNDLRISHIFDQIRSVSICQLSIPDMSTHDLIYFDAQVHIASSEFKKINETENSQQKIDLLVKVISTLTGDTSFDDEPPISDKPSSTTNKKISADVLLSLVILMIIRSGHMHLNAEISYIRHFSFRDIESGILGYTISTFEAALYHISTDSQRLEYFSQANLRFWADIKVVDDIMPFVTAMQSEMPLDDCNLILKARTVAGESALMLAIVENKLSSFISLLTFDDIYDDNFLLSDTTFSGTSLLMAAIQGERSTMIETLWNRLKSISTEKLKKYLAISDDWQRTVGHYLFHSYSLIPQLGPYIDWKLKDRNGQTPMFALCRCYDHPDYDKILDLAFEQWQLNERNGSELNILDHNDNKENTLLHIVKDQRAVERLMKFQVDVNWPNDKGMTAIMLYSKFSRNEAIKTLSLDPRVNLELEDNRGFTVFDMAKDPTTLKILERKCHLI